MNHPRVSRDRLAELLADKELVAEARNWVLDCDWVEDSDEIASLPDHRILRGVDRHYSGGLRQFHADFYPDHAAQVAP